jgi:hypothetical protein
MTENKNNKNNKKEDKKKIDKEKKNEKKKNDKEKKDDEEEKKDDEEEKKDDDEKKVDKEKLDNDLLTTIIFVINNENENNNENYDDYYDDYYDNNYYDDNYYDDNYYDDNKKEKNKNEKNEKNDEKKRKKDIANLDTFFQNIINNNSKNINKKVKKQESNDFKDYFKESDVLLPIDKEIKSLKDLIDLGNTYDLNDKNRYVINLRALNKCVNPLKDLDAMIGMKNIKEMIIDLIFFRLQNLEDTKDELWHLVIQGTPGSGKTEVARIIGKLYYSLGIIKNDKFTLVKRSDLIGKYLGHTAKMTQEVFDNAKGGILFIDEAYSLGNPEQRDSFSKECIDTINQNLTENKETVVFIAGYKDQLNESFFSYNPGLNRRFKMRMTVDKYNASDLRDIFIKKIKENLWSIFDDDIDKEIPMFFFEKNLEMFKYNGGDMENLWHLTKIVHARRIFGKPHNLMKKIKLEDIENAFKLYCENDEVKNRKNDIDKYILNTMYC